MTKAERILTKIAAGPTILYHPVLLERMGMGGFSVGKNQMHDSPSFKNSLATSLGVSSKKLDSGVVVLKDKDNKFVRAHELTHWIRDKKDKWSIKKYDNNILARFTEEAAANRRALKKVHPEKPIRSTLAAGLMSAGQELLRKRKSLGYKVLDAAKALVKRAGVMENLKEKGQYGWYVTKHKANIVSPMLQMQLPLTQALAHDLSKYRPSEFVPYSKWFEGPKGLKGTQDPELRKEWRKAVELHYSRNMHHWKKMGLKPEQVPLKYRLESVADWYSVGKTNRPKGTKFPAFKEWYAAREQGLPIDTEAKNEIDKRLGLQKTAYIIEKIDWAVTQIRR